MQSLITELHDRHKDTPIWIVGSGPSLDTYPVNFLMDMEPRLSNDIGKDDNLQLEILSDHRKK